MLTYIILLFSSICLASILILAVWKLFRNIDILDNPKKYWKKRKPIPYSMGVIFFLSFFILSFIFVDYSYKLFLIWVFGWVITAISFLDDLTSMSAKARLLIQIVIGATIGITSIKIGYVSNIFGWVIELETLSALIAGKEIFIIPLIFTSIMLICIINSAFWSHPV